MRKIKMGILALAALVAIAEVKAQGIEDGKKFLYYERFKSAKAVFEKLLAANPGNLDAAYWLGQTHLGLENVQEAKSLYQKTLMANPNSPLLLAGMGHIELLEGKTQDARSRFETAISLSQSKNIGVLNAVGLANTDAKAGDAVYAIDKLKLATTIKGFKDADVYSNLGDAYRKITDGGSALKAYESALGLVPNYAKASYKIGKIYQTQGRAQEELYMNYYNQAIAKDAAYAPVYFNLYTYFYETNVTRSAEYLEKYLSNSDDDPKNCYYRASMKYAQGLFQEAVTKSDECIAAAGNAPYPNLFGLKGYAYNRLNDSVNAKTAFEQYFKNQVAEKLGPNDYATYAKLLLKFPGNDIQAGEYMDKAVQADSLESGKIDYIRTMALYYDGQKNFKLAADWYKKLLLVKKNFGKTDIFNAGNNYTKAGEYLLSVEMFDRYIQKFPGESLGYYMNARNYVKLDSTDAEGKALANYTKITDMADSIKDKPGERDRIKNSLRYLIEFYANVKRDKTNSLLYCDKGIALDPADTEFVTIKEQISKMNFTAPKPPAAKPATTPAKPATTPAKPGTKPATTTKPAAKPATKPTTKPAKKN
jgi:tetratricopeptide (TPR) repeat protein